MWYFTWILGVLLACAFGIINVMWLEVDREFSDGDDEKNEDRE
jgi:cyd operon protein YbgT